MTTSSSPPLPSLEYCASMGSNREAGIADVLRSLFVAGLIVAALFNLRLVALDPPVVKIQLIIDEAAVLSETQSAFIVDYHNALLDDYAIDYRVVTTQTAESMDDFASSTFSSLEAGTFSESARGVLLVVNPATGDAQLEVGDEVKTIYTGPFVRLVEHDQMAPFIAEGRVGEGIVATSELIATRALEAAKNLDFDPDTAQEPAPEAIAASPVPGEQASQEALAPMPDVRSEGSPVETVNAYIQAMDEGNARPDLDIYTNASQEMLKDWLVTKAQMRNVAREHRRCTGERYQTKGDKAVVRYDSEPGVCNPYFLTREDGKWRIDFVLMQKYIRFDENNHWSLPWGAGEMAFAFPDIPPESVGEDKCRWCFTFRREDLVILSVAADSAGGRMGLEVGDKIVKLDGERSPSMEWVYSHLYTVEPGAVVSMTVVRNGKQIDLSYPAP